MRIDAWTACACAWLACLLASGCSMPPQPAPASTLQVPAAWHAAPSTPASDVRRDWWRGFGDPALAALVGRALDYNTDVRVAQARLQEYRARITIASSAQLPLVSGSFAPGKGRVISSGVPVETSSVNASVQASYEVDVFGRLAAGTAAARFDYQAQQAAADATALSVAANVASGYLNLRGLDAQLALARATLGSRQRSFDLARRQFQVGYSSRLELMQAEAELHTAAGVVPQVERSITLQENALDVLVGSSPVPVGRGRSLADLSAPAIAPGLPSELLRRRPDVAQAERTIAAADANLAAARDQLLPSIRLTASAGVQAANLPALLRSPTDLWSIGGSVLAPLFDGGRLRAQADIAGSLRDRAVFAYEGVVRTAFAETENSLASIGRFGEQLKQAQSRAVVAAEVLRIAHNRYANGYASYLEELDAQRNLYTAENNVLVLQASLLAAHVDLFRALGGGWTPAR
jgi:NodT family efflux transporter outer membrane factor (OMF) lipoprotein